MDDRENRPEWLYDPVSATNDENDEDNETFDDKLDRVSNDMSEEEIEAELERLQKDPEERLEEL